MKKMIQIWVCLLLCGSVLSACAKKSSSDTSTDTQSSGSGGSGGTGGGSSKGMISSWNGGSGVWILDLTAGNLTGSTFTATVTGSGGDVCLYHIQLSGSDASGTCTVVTPGSYAGGGSGDPGCASNSVNMCGNGGAPTGSGSYTNSGTLMQFSNNGIPWR